MNNINRHLKKLHRSIQGDIQTDLLSRKLYSTDASIYQELPIAIVRPKNKDDCIKIVKFAKQYQYPLIFRAAGTSTAGQVVGSGIIVDISRFMTKILLKPTDDNTITVQPGVNLDQLNSFLNRYKLKFPVNISTSNRCMIGGMIGNNAAGSHSVIYKTTRDHIAELEVILTDGTEVTFKNVNNKQLNKKLKLRTLEGEIYREIFDIIEKNRERILEKYPHSSIIRRNTGYALDYIANNQPWNESAKPFNLAPFLAGSEGTLALITKIKLNLVPTVKHNIVVCVHYSDFMNAIKAVTTILKYTPAAIELFDKKVLDLSNKNIEQRNNRFWIEGNPEAVLVVEFFAQTKQAVETISQKFVRQMKEKLCGYAWVIVRGGQIDKVWSVRKAGLGLLMGKKGRKKPVALIEDTAVRPQDLYNYIIDVKKIMVNYSVECVYYGHASVGLLHLRPELDLSSPSDLIKFNKIAECIAVLIKKYRGSLSGEHGDGRLRGKFIKSIIGKDIYNSLIKVKHTFDPDNIYNPGKILTNQPIDKPLRIQTIKHNELPETQFNWSSDIDFLGAIEKCNGTAVCRKKQNYGAMCPSYHVTDEEKYTTRGRANILRQSLQSNDIEKALSQKEIKDIFDYCLSCKACKSECPSNIDMAKLKSEYLYQYNKYNNLEIASIITKNYSTLIRVLSKFPTISNKLLKLSITKKLLDFDQNISLPNLSTTALNNKNLPKQSGYLINKGYPEIILLIDVHTQYFLPNTANSTIIFFKKLGYKVTPIFIKESIRLLISKGYLKEAKRSLSKLITKLINKLSETSIILGLEPSELLILRDEAIDLTNKDSLKNINKIKEQSMLYEEFLLHELENKRIKSNNFSNNYQQLLIHLHCHQQTLKNTILFKKLFSFFPNVDYQLINKGCCGMAGDFGYEHYQFSKKIAEINLLPKINKITPEVKIIANGFSCKQQIQRLSKIKTIHLAEFFNFYR